MDGPDDVTRPRDRGDVARALSVAIAIVGLVVVGGVATVQVLSPRPRATPAAVMLPQQEPDPTPTILTEPSPSPAPPEVVAQGSPADWADDWDLCGLALAAEQPATAFGFTVTAAGLPATTTVGGTWTGGLSARTPLGAPTGLEVVGSVALLDGAVVGVPRSAPASYVLTAASTAPVDLTVPGDLASCVGAPAGPGGTQEAPPLAAGRYEIVVLLRSTAEGTTRSAVASVGDLVITGNGGAGLPTVPAAALAPVGWTATLDQTACASSPPADSTGRPAGYPTALIAGGARLVDGSLVATVTVLNTGRSLSEASVGPVTVQVRRDGKVVGQGATAELPAAAIGAWGSGVAVELSLAIGPLTCTYMNGEPWPPGDYELYASVTTAWGAGTAAPAGSGPWSFTLP